MLPMCFSRMDVSTDMQHALLARHVTSRGLDLRSNCDLDFLGQDAYISTRLDERNTMASELCHQFCLSPKVFAKPFLPETAISIFLDLYSLACKSQNNSGGILTKEQLKSYRAFFRSVLTITGSEIRAHFRKIYNISLNNLTSDDLWRPLLTTGKK